MMVSVNCGRPVSGRDSGGDSASNAVMMRRVFLGLAPVTLGAVAFGQTHAVKKPESVVRAVAVYEYTGEEGKATASRVVPVSLFINGQLQDAGVYLAQPVPFALDTGTIYETEKNGVPVGTVELSYERHLTSGDTAEIDDGWLGYGAFKPRPKETLVAKKQSGPLPKVVSSADTDKPHFAGKTPTGSSDKGSTTDDSSTAADKDRPTFHKRPSSGDDTTTPSTTSTGAAKTSTDDDADADDKAERPTLKRRTPAEVKADAKKKQTAKVTGGGDLNDDPDRPNLHRGAPASRLEEQDLPPLRGNPKDMKQLVAVSDAKGHAEHNFKRAWQDDAERVDVLGKMQAFARVKLAEYKGVAAAPVSAPAAAPAKKAPVPTTAAARAAAARKAAAAKKAAAAAASAPMVLTDEHLEGYELSYGGAPTYVYTATAAAVGGVSRYVTVVAQEEPMQGLKVALASVTDSSHLDRTPWMRPVDVVDAEASNRASLLMELRGAHTRQFALYRVIGGAADQVFVSGTTE